MTSALVDRRSRVTAAHAETAGYPAVCIHTLIEQQVARTPAAVAAVYGNETVTYEALNTSANRLAWHLRRRGVRPEQLIGLCLESSFDAAIAVLATLKAGAAYMWLPVSDPPARLADVTREAGVALVLATTRTAAALRSLDAEVICLDSAAPTILAEATANPDVDVRLDQLACIRLTSGSTGTPKAIMHTHRLIVGRLALPLPDILPTDVCAVNVGHAFGPRLFIPLALGASVVVISDQQMRDPTLLARQLAASRVTSVYLVPSLLRKMLALDAPLTESLRGLRAITSGGESLTPDLLDRCLARLPDALLMNLYGNSETSGALLRVVNDTKEAAAGALGWPVTNTRVYVLDSDQQPVADGEVGEIYVSSPHMARGYQRRPGLTAERFVADPAAISPGARMYRTGDLGRVHANGCIEFVGRADRQVKIRGFRVELGEIEAVLLSHPQVLTAAVVPTDAAGDGLAAGGPDQDRRLIGYVVSHDNADLRVTPLREFMRARLPEHMVPWTFVVLDSLPLLRTGKIDRMALPLPSANRPDLDTPYAPPRHDVEAAVAAIWAGALHLDQVGIHDHFLDLGGDSLTATMLVAEVKRQFGVELAVRLLFDRPTVAAFTETLIA
jgi:amino acid adenylation domain-containing protein